MQSKIYLREEKEHKTINITSSDKPVIDDVVLEKWQHIVNLISKLVDVPSGLITKITEETLDVFLKNNNADNPFSVGGRGLLGEGVYCETAMGRDNELLVENALEDSDWKENPEVELKMIAYYGIPIKWPDNEFFGTLCVLDDKANAFNEDFKEIMKEFRNSIEKDLALLFNRKKLVTMAEHDLMTGAYNRHKMDNLLHSEFMRSKRTGDVFSLALIDLNSFKEINDTYGHEKGDLVLKTFSQSIIHRLRSTDYFGRWGGDEFIILCPNTRDEELRLVIQELSPLIVNTLNSVVTNFSFSYGISSFELEDTSYDQIVKRADLLMYEMKKEYYILSKNNRS